MASWCRGVLLVLCLAVLSWNGAEADETNADNHACTYFRDIDFDCDLKLTLNDFLAMFTRVVQSGKFNLPFKIGQVLSLASEALHFFPLVGQNTVWNVLTGGLKLQIFRDSMKDRRNNKKEELEDSIRKLVKFIHKTFSTNSATKNLSYDNFRAVYYAFRIPESAEPAGFADLDLNGDGEISEDECFENAKSYFIDAPADGRTNSWAGVPYTCDYVVAKTDCIPLTIIGGVVQIVAALG